MDPITDLQEPDESRPAKRVRLEAPLGITEDVQEEMVDDDEDDWDDIYGSGVDGAVDSKLVNGGGEPVASAALSASQQQLPGLSDNSSVSVSTASLGDYIPHASNGETEAPATVQEGTKAEEFEDGLPKDAVEDSHDIDIQGLRGADIDGPSAKVLEETTQIEVEPTHKVESPGSGELEALNHDRGIVGTAQDAKAPLPAAVEFAPVEETDVVETQGTTAPIPLPAQDPDFLEAAAAQKDNQDAEWQFDSSDAKSSSDSSDDSSSDSSSEDSEAHSEGGYEMLDPATAAKILMSGDGDDEEGKNKNTGDHQPRTANEVKEEVVPKPDVVVTEDMKTTFLGTVDRTVGNLVVIKGATPGEYQVLESGSVLCNENREVIGAVMETLGRVQEPMYSVAFTNAKEIEAAGLEFGTKIFYVDSHSTFVFTQPLKNMKGTDASNIHDEEVGEDEIEFSDDEAEAEYKRQKKLAKRGGRGGLSRTAFNEERAGMRTFGAPGHDSGHTFVNGNDAPHQQYGGGLAYDDGDVQEEFYSPLKRPDNLSQMMASGGLPPRPQFEQFDRGRGRGRGDRGRGRGRGDRGRGRGGFDRRDQRGGRGGYRGEGEGGGRGAYGQQNGHRGVSHSYPDRHNNDYDRRQHSLPPKPAGAPHSSSPPPPQQQHYPTYQPYPQKPRSPQTYQFNGYSFQYGNSPPQPPPAQQFSNHNQQQQQFASSLVNPIPPGAYVNPAFFQNQQNQWTPPQPPQQQQAMYGGGWAAQNVLSQHGGAAYGSPAQAQQQQDNLAEILRQFGGQQQQ